MNKAFKVIFNGETKKWLENKKISDISYTGNITNGFDEALVGDSYVYVMSDELGYKTIAVLIPNENKVDTDNILSRLKGNFLISNFYSDCELLKKYIDLSSIDYFAFSNEDSLREAIDELINVENIIFHASAMDFLKENDPSLKNSLEIASEFDYELKKINSEILATLLLQSLLKEEINSKKLSDFFELIKGI